MAAARVGPRVTSGGGLATGVLLTEIYEGIRRGAQICIADFAPGGIVDLSYLVIKKRDQ